MRPDCSRTRRFTEAGTLAALKTRFVVHLASLIGSMQKPCQYARYMVYSI